MISAYYDPEELKRLVAVWFAIKDNYKITPGTPLQLNMFVGVKKIVFAATVLKTAEQLSQAKTDAQIRSIVAEFLIQTYSSLAQHKLYVTFRVADALMEEIKANLDLSRAPAAISGFSQAIGSSLPPKVVRCLNEYWIKVP